MDRNRSPKRGDVFWVDLDPTVGSEQGKKRPCVIISPDVLNLIPNWNTVQIAPITSAGTPDAVRVPMRTNGKVKGLALVHQTRVIDKTRLTELAGRAAAADLGVLLLRLQLFYAV